MSTYSMKPLKTWAREYGDQYQRMWRARDTAEIGIKVANYWMLTREEYEHLRSRSGQEK